MLLSRRKTLVLAVVAIVLVIYFQNTSVFVIHNDDFGHLTSNLVLTELDLNHSLFNYGFMMITTVLGVNFYLEPTFKPLQDLRDDDKVILDVISGETYREVTIGSRGQDSTDSHREIRDGGSADSRTDNTDRSTDNTDGRSDNPNSPQTFYKYLGYNTYYKFTYKKLINDETPIIRNLDLFNDIEEVRPYYSKVSLNSFNRKSIHFMKMTNLESLKYLDYLQKYHRFKVSGDLISSGSNFKVFQISDLHFLNGIVDSRTKEFIIKSISLENPNLIILNGDIIDFVKLKYSDLNTILMQALNLFIELKIPYMVNFGDSDYINYQENLSILQFISNLPYCLNSVNPSSLHGLTNYNFKVYNKDSQLIGIVSLLDSKDNNLKSNQIHSVYRFNMDLAPTADIFKLLFVHYPLPNFRPVGKFKIVGSYNEKGPLNTSTDSKFINDFLNMGYNVISASHEHENDGCILHERHRQDSEKPNDEIWLCYSSIGGFQGKTNDVEYDRKIRVFEIVENRLLSWRMSELKGKAIDHHLIAKMKESPAI